MRRRQVITLGLLSALLVFIVITMGSIMSSGLSTMAHPTAVEAFLARSMRRFAVPSDLRRSRNPVPRTAEVVSEARAHFADHCAGCHGNDGKGTTSMGPRFYPRVADLTAPATQAQSDGALFAAIENGIRMSGMPSFGSGTAESAYGSWSLVHFIRHLPNITPEELAEMEKLNPKSPAQWRQIEKGARLPMDQKPPRHETQAHQH